MRNEGVPAGIAGGVTGIGRIGPRRNRREVAGPAAGSDGPHAWQDPEPAAAGITVYVS